MTMFKNAIANFQALGRALMLPIAVLPVAGLLLRLGQPDILDIPFVAAAGNAIFGHLGLLFAIGVAVGLAKENNGAAGLAGAVAFVVLTEGSKILMHAPIDLIKGAVSEDVSKLMIETWKNKQVAKLSVPAGILTGLSAGYLYNRFHNIKLPEYLGFFGGRRFVPIAAGFAGVLGALIFGLGFEYLEKAIDVLSHWVVKSGSFGLFVYGALNRLLIVTGLHHVINNLAWFIIGDFNGTTGDLNRFFAGDPNAGKFMSGFFPVMMFGLPAACLAMYRAAPKEKRAELSGMFISLALTSFITGVTEPIEFTFMFLAPVLYGLHAVLTGISMSVMDILGIRLGFGFSAGLFDYALNYKLATKPLLLIPVGIIYSLIYYFSFSFFIRRFNLMTPGREIDENTPINPTIGNKEASKPLAYIDALGGSQNLVNIDACTTRLRLIVKDNMAINDKKLKEIGAIAVLRLDKTNVQIVIGPMADSIAGEIRANLSNTVSETVSNNIEAPKMPNSESTSEIGNEIIEALGGKNNIIATIYRDQRAIIELRDNNLINLNIMNAELPGKWVLTGNGNCHILL